MADITPWDGLKADGLGIVPPKPKNYRKTDVSEEAVVVAMAASGATEKEIGTALDRSSAWVSRHKKAVRELITEHRKDIVDDRVEDYTDVITLCLFRMRERLADGELAAAIKDNDLANMLKATFTARQLVIKEPTRIDAVVGEGGLKGRKLVNALSTAEEFNRNFPKLVRAMVMQGKQVALVGDVVDGEFEEAADGADSD
jgi:hypothetical protein